MIRMTELKKSMLAVLKERYPSGYRFYGTEVEEGYEKPSFFTQLIPVMMENSAQQVTDNLFLFVITYFQKQRDETDALEKVSEIQEAYGLKVRVGNRYVNVTEVSCDFVGNGGNILQIQVTISYKDQIGKKEEERERMEILEWRYKDE